MNVDLVLEGGGVRGIALLGAVLRLAEEGFRFPRIAGASAGAIVAAFVAAYQRAGRDLHELDAVLSTRVGCSGDPARRPRSRPTAPSSPSSGPVSCGSSRATR